MFNEIIICPECNSEESVVGIEVEGVYDGILFWRCLKDNKDFHRFPEGTRQYNSAQELFDKWEAIKNEAKRID